MANNNNNGFIREMVRVRDRFPFIQSLVENEIVIIQDERKSGLWGNLAVNWADLRCAYVTFVVDDSSAYYSVVVEELSPTCYKIRDRIQSAFDRLDTAVFGGYKVYVETEW